MPLALLLMRADTPTDSGQVGAFVDDAHGLTHVTHCQCRREVGDVVLNRTALTALGNLTVQTAFGLVDGLLHAVRFVYHLEIVVVFYLHYS